MAKPVTVPRGMGVKIILLCVMIVAAVFLGLKSCYRAIRPAEQAQAPASTEEQIVSLEGGSTMMAERGSLGRDIADWLNANTAGERSFEMAGEPFGRGSAELTPDGHVKVGRFVAVMKADRRVKARLMVYVSETGDKAADHRLAAQRAERLRGELVTAGISPNRIEVEAPEAVQPGSPLVIVLSREI